MAIQIEKISDTKIWIHDGATNIMTIDTTNGVLIGSGLNLSSITADATELNKNDGLTATATNLNLLTNAQFTTNEIGTLAGGTAVKKKTKTINYADFTDGGAAVGTYTISDGIIPAGATFLYGAITAATGFTGDSSAVMTIGDGTDADRYNTGTINVFADLATGIGFGDPSGTRFHQTAKSPVITITKGSDWGAGTAGSVSVVYYYLPM